MKPVGRRYPELVTLQVTSLRLRCAGQGDIIQKKQARALLPSLILTLPWESEEQRKPERSWGVGWSESGGGWYAELCGPTKVQKRLPLYLDETHSVQIHNRAN